MSSRYRESDSGYSRREKDKDSDRRPKKEEVEEEVPRRGTRFGRDEGRSRRDDDSDRRRDRDHRERGGDRDRGGHRDDDTRDNTRRSYGDRDRRPGQSSRRSASPPSRSRDTGPPPGISAQEHWGLAPDESGDPEADAKALAAAERAKPNFAPSGLLAAATNTVQSADGKQSTVLKYNEPPEARKPIVGWRLYVFKGTEQVELLHIQRQSAYLIGRDRMVADIPIEHPSCSKQHAVIQYRHIQQKDEYGTSKGIVKPFIIDLESTNGTHVNDEKIPVSRYYELKPSDVIKFGQSTREYVILHDADDAAS